MRLRQDAEQRPDGFNFAERASRDRAESGLAAYTVPAHEGSCIAFVLLNDWHQDHVTYARLEAGEWVPRTAFEIIDLHDPAGIPRREAAKQARVAEEARQLEICRAQVRKEFWDGQAPRLCRHWKGAWVVVERATPKTAWWRYARAEEIAAGHPIPVTA